MPEEFNARKEAKTIEGLAEKLRYPLYPIERADLQKKLQDEVDGLTLQQMRSVGLIVEKDTPRREMEMGNMNDVIIDSDNNVQGFVFKRGPGSGNVEVRRRDKTEH